VRVRLEEDGSATLGERYSTFVDPGVDVGPAITRLTGIRDGDLIGAPALESVTGRVASFIAGATRTGQVTARSSEVSMSSAMPWASVSA